LTVHFAVYNIDLVSKYGAVIKEDDTLNCFQICSNWQIWICKL